MSIELQALKMKLSGENIPTQYLSEDLQFIIGKAEIYRKKNGKYPSIEFLLSSASKMSNDSEQVDRLTDLLYATSILKSSEMDCNEIAELVLEDYKKDKIREATKALASALVKDNAADINKLSKQIQEINALNLNQDLFRKNDIKTDLNFVKGKIEYLPTFFPSDLPALSKVPRGSLIIIIGKSGTGKSILSLQAMVDGYLKGYNQINLNYELPKPTIISRMKSYITQVPLTEIVDDEFLLEESKQKVWLFDYVIKYKISMDKAFAKFKELKYKEEAFIQYLEDNVEPRNNLLKIIAADDLDTYKKLKDSGQQLDNLPTDVEILEMLKREGEYFDNVYIDLISEVSYSSKGSREENITNFTRALNDSALMQGLNIYLISQPRATSNFDGLSNPKYSAGLYQSASLVVSLIGSKEMKADKVRALYISKARHGEDTSQTALMYEDFAIQRFSDTGETTDAYDFEENISKELKKSNGEKK